MLLHDIPASAVFSSHMHGYLQDARLRAQSCKETAQPSLDSLHKTTLLLDYKLDIKPEHRLRNYSCHTAQRGLMRLRYRGSMPMGECAWCLKPRPPKARRSSKAGKKEAFFPRAQHVLH